MILISRFLMYIKYKTDFFMEIKGDKFLIFSDIHWGINNDVQYKLDNTDKCIDWIIKTALDSNVKTILFLGDWFHNRNYTSVKTSYTSYKAVKRMSDSGLSVILLVGNHDAYFKESVEVNSLASFDNLENVTVIDTPTECAFNDKDLLLVPWAVEHKIEKKYDMILGHFEFAGGSFNSVMTCKHGISGAELTKKAPVVFSGHFHLRKEYDYKNGKIITVGCPLQLDWGDCGDDKGVYLVDFNLGYKFIKNTVNAEHLKFNYSTIGTDIKQHKIEGNYITLLVDVKVDYDKIVKIQSYINSKQPGLPCKLEYVCEIDDTSLKSNEGLEDSEFTNKRDQLYEYTEYLFENGQNIVKGIEEQGLKDMLVELYNEAEGVNE